MAHKGTASFQQNGYLPTSALKKNPSDTKQKNNKHVMRSGFTGRNPKSEGKNLNAGGLLTERGYVPHYKLIS